MPESNEEIRLTQQAFYEMYKFPKVIGCIDGTHIRIQSPGKLKLKYTSRIFFLIRDIFSKI